MHSIVKERVSWTVADLLAAFDARPISPDRGGYTLTMRECAGSEESLAWLEQDTTAAGRARLHVGWGSFRNLDLMAARRSTWGLLLDVNVHQLRVWQAVRQAVATAADAQAFVHAVVPLLSHTPRLRQFAASTLSWLCGDLERPGSWLYQASPQRYRHVRTLFCESRIAVACADLRERAGTAPVFERLASRLREAALAGSAVADTLYISNIPWMLAQPLGFFGESHQPYLRDGAATALELVHANLAALAPGFQWVVSAMQLRSDATPDNLQWLTQVKAPVAFLDEANWGRAATPASGVNVG